MLQDAIGMQQLVRIVHRVAISGYLLRKVAGSKLVPKRLL